jgi:lysophospholipase L1-like esterase
LAVKIAFLAAALALLSQGATLAGSPAGTAAGTLPRDRAAAFTYVALGDSTVVGVGASRPELGYVGRLQTRLRQQYPRARLVNLGQSGATAADVAREQLPRAVALSPGLVTLSIGPNDVTGGRTVEQYERDVERIFQAVRQQSGAVLVVNLLPDLAVAPRFSAEEKALVGVQTARYNQALQRLAARYGVQVVDLYHPSQREAAARPELLSGDAYHPSDLGYARWAELMWQGVAARIPT